LQSKQNQTRQKPFLIIAATLVLFVACSTSESNPPAPLPTVVGLDVETVTKPKKALETPDVVKQVYDPAQDITVRTAFRGLMQARRQAGYFKGWSRHLTYRSNTYAPTEKRQKRWDETIEQNPIIEAYDEVLRRAYLAQLLDYARAGCSWESNLCPGRRIIGEQPVFTPCPDKEQSNWGDFRPSSCEKYQQDSDDIILIAVRYNPPKPKPSDKTEDFCFEKEHIGDPKRGDFDKQFAQYFELSCRWI